VIVDGSAMWPHPYSGGPRRLRQHQHAGVETPSVATHGTRFRTADLRLGIGSRPDWFSADGIPHIDRKGFTEMALLIPTELAELPPPGRMNPRRRVDKPEFGEGRRPARLIAPRACRAIDASSSCRAVFRPRQLAAVRSRSTDPTNAVVVSSLPFSPGRPAAARSDEGRRRL